MIFVFISLTFSMHFTQNFEFLIILKNLYAKVCHQIENRCFLIDEKPMFVCSRCTGIYFGIFTLFLILTLFKSLRKKFLLFDFKKLFLFALPLLFDWSLNFIFKIETTNFVRFLTGLLMSFIPVYLLNHLIIQGTKDVQ